MAYAFVTVCKNQQFFVMFSHLKIPIILVMDLGLVTALA